jgi:hypothetical protein
MNLDLVISWLNCLICRLYLRAHDLRTDKGMNYRECDVQNNTLYCD